MSLPVLLQHCAVTRHTSIRIDWFIATFPHACESHANHPPLKNFDNTIFARALKSLLLSGKRLFYSTDTTLQVLALFVCELGIAMLRYRHGQPAPAPLPQTPNPSPQPDVDDDTIVGEQETVWDKIAATAKDIKHAESLVDDALKHLQECEAAVQRLSDDLRELIQETRL